MKFRPQMQLRFRNEEQYLLIKEVAAKAAVSVNEFVLVAVESKIGQNGSKRTGELVRKGVPQATTVTRRRPPSRGTSESAEDRQAGAARVGESKGSPAAKPSCPKCEGTQIADFGPYWLCKNPRCGQKFPKG